MIKFTIQTAAAIGILLLTAGAVPTVVTLVCCAFAPLGGKRK
jgi:hypothetical protein